MRLHKDFQQNICESPTEMSKSIWHWQLTMGWKKTEAAFLILNFCIFTRYFFNLDIFVVVMFGKNLRSRENVHLISTHCACTLESKINEQVVY